LFSVEVSTCYSDSGRKIDDSRGSRVAAMSVLLCYGNTINE